MGRLLELSLMENYDTLTERFNELRTYVHDKLHPRVHVLEDEVLDLRARDAVHDGRIQDLRESTSTLRKIVVGNGEKGLSEQVHELAHLNASGEQELKVSIDTKFDALLKEIHTLTKWKEGIDNRFWAIILMFIGLVAERVWEMLVR